MSPKLWKWCKVAQASFYYFSLNHYLISYSNQASGEFERMDLNFILSQKKICILAKHHNCYESAESTIIESVTNSTTNNLSQTDNF